MNKRDEPLPYDIWPIYCWPHVTRASCEDTNKLPEWFQLVRQIIEEHGIADEDAYNCFETGFTIGMIAIARIITQVDKRTRPSLVQ